MKLQHPPPTPPPGLSWVLVLPSSEATSVLLTHLCKQGLTQLPPSSLPPGCLTSVLSSLFSMLTFLLRPVSILYLSSGLLVTAQFGGGFSPRYVGEGLGSSLCTGGMPRALEGKAFWICPNCVPHGNILRTSYTFFVLAG